ncbi:MAG: thiamine pyrophosphate-dependent enzyme, partial [Myxococcota bacterium]
ALPTVTTPRGVIIAGPRDRQDRLRDEPALARLCHSVAAKLGWPVLADITGGMRYHEGRPAITGYDSFLRSEATAERLHPECALLLGRPLTSKTTNQWLLERQIPVVVAGETPTHRDPRLNNVIEVRGGLREILERLNEAIDTTTSAPGWLELWHDAESAFLDRNREDSQWWEGAIARAAVRGLPAGALLHLSSSMPVRDADGFSGPLDRAVTVTSNRGVNGIDGVIATAAGQALAWKHGPSAVLIGDVAFLHDLGSLRHAVGANLNLTVIVVNNGGGRIFDFLPIHRHPTAFETFFRTDQRAEIEPIATGLGAAYSSVARVDELSEALAQATKAPGVNVIEAVTDGTHNRATHEQFHQSVLEALP